MRILNIYKKLEDVVIFEGDDGNISIRAMFEDEGTDEEKVVIKEKVMSTGFQINNSVSFVPEVKEPQSHGTTTSGV